MIDRLYQRLLIRMIGKRPIAMNIAVKGSLAIPADRRGVIVRGVGVLPS